MSNDNDEILELLDKKIAEAEHQLARYQAAKAALSNGADVIAMEAGIHPSRGVDVIPPIKDICAYLKEKGRPVHQNDIIRTIGEQRQARYPSLSNTTRTSGARSSTTSGIAG